MARTSLEVDELWERFHGVVNMTSPELTAWVGTEPGLDEPQPSGTDPSPLGNAVLAILSKRKTDVTDDDLTTMEKVIEVVEAETAGRTKDEIVNDERRRHRLMNVGHDPLRER